MSPVTETNLSYVHLGNLLLVTEMKNVQKAPPNTRGTALRLVSDLISHTQLKMFRHGQSRYPGWSVHMGKISSLALPRSRSQNPRFGNRASTPSHMNTSKFCKEKSGEARSRKPSQPGRLGS